MAVLWKSLFENNVHIDFAYRTFRWDSEANLKAQVHCVIISFSTMHNNIDKKLYNSENFQLVKNINGYLVNADNVFIEHRKKLICKVPEITKGNYYAKSQRLIIEDDDYADFVKREPKAKKYIKRLVGAKEYINNLNRYCLWLVNCPPNELRSMPLVMERVRQVREERLSSTDNQCKILTLHQNSDKQ